MLYANGNITDTGYEAMRMDMIGYNKRNVLLNPMPVKKNAVASRGAPSPGKVRNLDSPRACGVAERRT